MSISVTNPYQIKYACFIPSVDLPPSSISPQATDIKTKKKPPICERKANPLLVPSTNILKFLFKGCDAKEPTDKAQIKTEYVIRVPIDEQDLHQVEYSKGCFSGVSSISSKEGKDIAVIDKAVKITTHSNYIENQAARPEIVCFWDNRRVSSFSAACLGAVIAVSGAVACLTALSIISTTAVVVGLGLLILGNKRRLEAIEQKNAWACPIQKEVQARRLINANGFQATLNYPNINKAQFIGLFKAEVEKLLGKFEYSKENAEALTVQHSIFKDIEHFGLRSHFVKFGFDPKLVSDFLINLAANVLNQDIFEQAIQDFLGEVRKLA